MGTKKVKAAAKQTAPVFTGSATTLTIIVSEPCKRRKFEAELLNFHVSNCQLRNSWWHATGFWCIMKAKGGLHHSIKRKY